jgi:hypothetical protein
VSTFQRSHEPTLSLSTPGTNAGPQGADEAGQEEECGVEAIDLLLQEGRHLDQVFIHIYIYIYIYV